MCRYVCEGVCEGVCVFSHTPLPLPLPLPLPQLATLSFQSLPRHHTTLSLPDSQTTGHLLRLCVCARCVGRWDESFVFPAAGATQRGILTLTLMNGTSAKQSSAALGTVTVDLESVPASEDDEPGQGRWLEFNSSQRSEELSAGAAVRVRIDTELSGAVDERNSHADRTHANRNATRPTAAEIMLGRMKGVDEPEEDGEDADVIPGTHSVVVGWLWLMMVWLPFVCSVCVSRCSLPLVCSQTFRILFPPCTRQRTRNSHAYAHTHIHAIHKQSYTPAHFHTHAHTQNTITNTRIAPTLPPTHTHTHTHTHTCTLMHTSQVALSLIY
jgi:hypothetical protein